MREAKFTVRYKTVLVSFESFLQVRANEQRPDPPRYEYIRSRSLTGSSLRSGIFVEPRGNVSGTRALRPACSWRTGPHVCFDFGKESEV